MDDIDDFDLGDIDFDPTTFLIKKGVKLAVQMGVEALGNMNQPTAAKKSGLTIKQADLIKLISESNGDEDQKRALLATFGSVDGDTISFGQRK